MRLYSARRPARNTSSEFLGWGFGAACCLGFGAADEAPRLGLRWTWLLSGMNIPSRSPPERRMNRPYDGPFLGVISTKASKLPDFVSAVMNFRTTTRGFLAERRTSRLPLGIRHSPAATFCRTVTF